MPFPKSERVIYGKNPLVEVICQLRFPTILKIGEAQLADFQESIRAEYPIYESASSFELPQLPKQLSSLLETMLPRPPLATVHKFSTKDSKRVISVSQEFVAVADREYQRWEAFCGEVQRAEKALQEVYKPSFFTRIGLRYRDLIMRSKLGLAGVKWKDLLQQHIVGELGAEEVSEAITVVQTHSVIGLSEVPGGQVKLIHGLQRIPPGEEDGYLIDADFYVENKEGLSEPVDTLSQFNRLAGNLFRWAITDRLHRAMDPRPI